MIVVLLSVEFFKLMFYKILVVLCIKNNGFLNDLWLFAHSCFSFLFCQAQVAHSGKEVLVHFAH